VAQGLLDHLYQYEHQENVMKGSPAATRQQARYELRFKSLFAEGAHTRSHATRAGGVDLEALGDRVRNNHFYAGFSSEANCRRPRCKSAQTNDDLY